MKNLKLLSRFALRRPVGYEFQFKHQPILKELGQLDTMWAKSVDVRGYVKKYPRTPCQIAGDKEVWRFKVAVADQKLLLEHGVGNASFQIFFDMKCLK